MPNPFRTRTARIAIPLLALGIDVLALVALAQPGLSQTARLTFALLPVPGDIALIVWAVHWLRALDEFQQKVHLDAVAISFLSTGVAVFIYGCLQTAHLIGTLHAGLVWIFMLVFYAIGYAIGLRHYR